MGPEYIDIATKVATLGTAGIGFVLALVKAIGRFSGNKALLEKVNKSNLADDDKASVKSALNISRTPWAVLGIVCVFVGSFVVWNLSTTYTKESLSRSLRKHAPLLFRYSESGLYDVARVFPDKKSLDADSRLDEVIKRADHEFNMFSDHCISVVEDFEDELLNAIERGVKVRIVLLDPSALDDGTCDELIEAQERPKHLIHAKITQSVRTLTDWLKHIESDRTRYKGSLEVRMLKHPVFERLWIRDPTSEFNAMVHISVLQYRGRITAPCFRATNRSSHELVEQLAAEFEEVWIRSTPYSAP